MKASTLAVLKLEARLRGNHARLRLQAAQAALAAVERELALLDGERQRAAAAIDALRDAPAPTQAGAAQRKAEWLARLRQEAARIEARHRQKLAARVACEAALDSERREVGQALRSRQATETVERTGREQAARGRELATQSLLDEIAAWRAARRPRDSE